ncbi:MAG TPA: hypothetical protein VJZ69_03475, partial [Clostridia bacterium]|nr:hypothetical protein [Clostridia bacterium]
REMLWFDLAKYLKSSGKTVVYTTTQALEATSISDRIVALHLGEFKQVGRAEEIYNAPQSIWAVEQLDQNFSFGDALLEKTDNKLILIIDGMKLDVSFLEDKLISTKYIRKLVLFGAHCEDFEQNENGIECGVEINFGKSNGEYISYLSNGWRIKSKEKFEGQVKIAPKADKLFLFDKVSENSILK